MSHEFLNTKSNTNDNEISVVKDKKSFPDLQLQIVWILPIVPTKTVDSYMDFGWFQ